MGCRASSSAFRVCYVGLLRECLVPVPAEEDEVIEEQGARVFLEPDAASLLDDNVLDAKLDQNKVAFTIAGQT